LVSYIHPTLRCEARFRECHAAPSKSLTSGTWGLRPLRDVPVSFIAMATEHLATLRQSIPRMRQLLSNIEPTFRFETVAHIDARFLSEQRIRAVLWDVDGTLMAYHATDIDPRFPLIRVLFREGPARHAILSNCDERRFDQLAEIFPEIPLLRGYTMAEGAVFRHVWHGTDTLTREAVSRIVANGGIQIRKPSAELVRYGMRVLEESDPQAVLMVGDQYLTDIASANLAGTRSAKVRAEPIPRGRGL
jgi:predicted HAD superfamily phosphohydrolase YqeG